MSISTPSPDAPRPVLDAETNLVIDLAWADDVSFDEIKSRTGYTEGEVIKLMRRHLKPSSFRMWRKRVSGRATKHLRKRHPAPPSFEAEE
ncbi:MAG: TIGR03643 family protein [Alphaproteobacteria bacterium]|nr:TIGR03643 family protein [Alphaproteobacteria bacterium]